MKKILTILLCSASILVCAQGYQPTKHISLNDALFPANQTPINGRTMYYDTSLFKYRDFRDTTEVRLNRTTNASRFGHEFIAVHQGGTLNPDGSFTGGITTLWWYRNGLLNTDLAKVYIDSVILTREVDTLYRKNDSIVGFTIGHGPEQTILIRGTAAGGINSLSMGAPSGLFGTPVTFTNGGGGAWTGTLSLINQNPNTVFAGPTVGSPGSPGFRALVTADLPTGIPNGNLQNSVINFAVGSSGSSPNWTSSSTALGATATFNLPVTNGFTTGIVNPTQFNFWSGKVDSTIMSNDSVYEWRNGVRFFRYIIVGGGGGGIISLNGLTGTTQTFATGIAGTDFGISSVGTTHTFNLPNVFRNTRTVKSIPNLYSYATAGITDSAIVTVTDTIQGGTFMWVSTSTTVEDSGVVIKPTAIGGGSPGRWFRQYSGYRSVKFWGAKGDGTTNDTRKVQLAMNSCRGGTVYFPQGTYLVDSIGWPLVSVKGENRRTTRLQATAAGATALVKMTEGPMNELFWQDLSLVANASNVGQTGFDLTAVPGSTTGGLWNTEFDRIDITNFRGTGINLVCQDGAFDMAHQFLTFRQVRIFCTSDTASHAMVWRGQVNQTTVDDCEFDGPTPTVAGTIGVLLVSLVGSNDQIVGGNTFHNISVQGFDKAVYTFNAQGTTFKDDYFESDSVAIHATNSSRITVADIHLSNVGNTRYVFGNDNSVLDILGYRLTPNPITGRFYTSPAGTPGGGVIQRGVGQTTNTVTTIFVGQNVNVSGNSLNTGYFSDIVTNVTASKSAFINTINSSLSPGEEMTIRALDTSGVVGRFVQFRAQSGNIALPFGLDSGSLILRNGQSAVFKRSDLVNIWTLVALSKPDQYANTVPTTGTWFPGEVVYNNNPVFGAAALWICKTGGTPGVWDSLSIGGGSGFPDPLTTNGDIIARISGVTTRLPQGGNNTFLGVQGGTLGYYAPFSLTTTGTSGAATFSGGTLNIPQYSGGSGNTNSNVGSGFRWAVPNTNNIKTFFGSTYIGLDSTTNANALTAKMANSTANTLLGYDGSGVATNITAGTNVTIVGGVISASGGAAQTFPQVLATGRTVGTDSVIQNANTTFKFKGAQLLSDSFAIGAQRFSTIDTFYFNGDSRTIGIFSNDYFFRWTDLVCQRMQVFQKNNGVSGAVINSGTGNSMQTRLNTIPTKAARMAKMFWWFGTNDETSGLSVDSFAFGYRLCLNNAVSKGWTGADQYILFGWNNAGSNLVTQTLYRDSAKAIAASYGITFIDFSGITLPGERIINARMVGNGFYHDGTHEAIEGHNYVANYVLPRIKGQVKYDSLNVLTANGMVDVDKIRFHTGDTSTQYINTLFGISQEGRFTPVPFWQFAHDNPLDSVGQSITINSNGVIKGQVIVATGIPTLAVATPSVMMGLVNTGFGGQIFAGNGTGTVYSLHVGNTAKVVIGGIGDAQPTFDQFKVGNGGGTGNYWRAIGPLNSWDTKGVDLAFDSLSTRNWGLLQARGTTASIWYTTKISSRGGGIILGDTVDIGYGVQISKQLFMHKDSVAHITSAASMECLVLDTVTRRVSRITIPSGGSGITTLNTLTASTQTFAVGTSGTDFGIVSSTSTHTFNIPDAGASARGLVTTGTQTFAGLKTMAAPKFTGLTSAGSNDSVLTIDPVTNQVHWRNGTSIINFGNGLMGNGVDSAIFGSPLDRNTTLGTAGFTFSITGLPNKATPLSTDSVLIENAAGRLFKLPVPVNIYNSDGAITANRSLGGGGFNLSLGTSGDKLQQLIAYTTTGLVIPSGGINILGTGAGSGSSTFGLLINGSSSIVATSDAIHLAISPGTNNDPTSSGTVSAVYSASFKAPTLTATNTVTYTTAATVTILGAPIASTNVTLTNNYAFRINSGVAYFGGNITAPGSLASFGHYISNEVPSIAAGAGAGTSPTISITGTDQSGVITLTTGTTPTGSNATIATVTYQLAFATNSFPTLTAANSTTAALSGTTMVYTTGTTTTFTITSGTLALAAATQYKWFYSVGGN